MKFVKSNENVTPYVDNIFSVVNAAKADPEAINATAGCLYDEEGKLLTFDIVNKCAAKVTDIQKAAYAQSPSGNKDYIEAVTKFVLDDKVTNHYGSIATPGGTGAIYTALKTCTNDGDTIIYPEIAWGNYKVMSNEFNLNVLTYDVYNLEDLFNKIDSCTDKVFVIVNSPCENPLGASYSIEEWKKIIDKLNSLNKEAILLCDIAYIDYAHNDPKGFMKLFNDISDNLLVLIAASCSKAFSYYGQRLGALIAINNDKVFLDLYINLCSRLARSTWSNLNNSAMITIGNVLINNLDQYHKELNEAKDVLKKRIDLFIRQADECGLEYYRFNDGFFITLKTKNNDQRDIAHQKLIDQHIYTIKVNKGIRVALCSTPLKIVDGLAYKIKELM